MQMAAEGEQVARFVLDSIGHKPKPNLPQETKKDIMEG